MHAAHVLGRAGCSKCSLTAQTTITLAYESDSETSDCHASLPYARQWNVVFSSGHCSSLPDSSWRDGRTSCKVQLSAMCAGTVSRAQPR